MACVPNTEILAAIAALTEAERGRPPTVRELARKVGLVAGSGSMHYRVKMLRERGLIERVTPGVACTLRLTDAGLRLIDRAPKAGVAA